MTRYTVWLAVWLAVGCQREVIVQSESAMTPAPPFVPRAGAGGFGGGAGIAQPPTGGGGGIVPPAAGIGGDIGGGGAAAGSGGAIAGSGGVAGPLPTGVLAGVDQAGPAASTVLDRFEVLADDLRSIERPAVGTAGVSLLQHQGASRALILSVRWDQGSDRWYASSGAYHAFSAAYLDQHFALLHAESYGIFANGGGAELSTTPGSYKEFLAASAAGIAWVDYPEGESLGEVVLQDTGGARTVLSDRLRYRASVALSPTHAAFVEYPSTEPGSFGQVMIVPLAGGGPFPAAPSPHHQDHPAMDGEWLVFEEYRSESDAVIRAINVASGETRELSTDVGFRSHADIQGTRVAWEDYRNSNGDIYWTDLTVGTEQPLITGVGHSAFPRLSTEGVVWVESAGSQVALARARWLGSP